MAGDDARRRVVFYPRFDVVALTPADLLPAIDLHRLHRLSIWDGLLIRAALNGACAKLHTEDMQPGYIVDRLTFVNPFDGIGRDPRS